MLITSLARILLGILMLAPPATSQSKQYVLVDIDVILPKDTPDDATVYLSGNLPELGSWKPDAVRLSRVQGGKRAGMRNFRMFLPEGEVMQFKLSLGSVGTAETFADGTPFPGRATRLAGRILGTVEVEAWGKDEPPKARPTTRSGDIRIIEDFESRILGNQRRIWVYLPPGYDTSTDRYPVLYMHDGQNCFDDVTSNVGEWGADEAAERLIRAGKIKPIIIVGIDNIGAGRMDEYGPTMDSGSKAGGKGDDYARFLLTELKLQIDATYRTQSDRDNTAVCGASAGGLISLYIASRYADAVGLCAAISPTLPWNKFDLQKQLVADPSFVRRCRLWIDAGTLESLPYAFGMTGKYGTDDELTEACRELVNSFEKAGLQPGKDFVYLEVEDAQHNEHAWAARFDQVLLFLFSKP